MEECLNERIFSTVVAVCSFIFVFESRKIAVSSRQTVKMKKKRKKTIGNVRFFFFWVSVRGHPSFSKLAEFELGLVMTTVLLFTVGE
jgi:hypothetical protein